MEDKFDSTQQSPSMTPLDIPQQSGSDHPLPDEKPPLPPEAMLTPPPRLQPSYISTPRPEQPLPSSTAPVAPSTPVVPPTPVAPPISVTPPAPPETLLTPPTPMIQNQAPADGFRQPAIAGHPVTPPQYGGPTPPKDSAVYASDYERIMALPPISKEEAYSYRHSHERRWYRRLIELNVLIILSVLILLVVNFKDFRTDMQDFSDHLISDVLAEQSDAEADSDESTDSETDAENENEKEKAEREKEREKERERSKYIETFMEEIPSEITLFFYGLLSIVTLFFTLYLNFASIKAASLKITQNNFPEIYSLIHSYAYRLGMKRVPEAYIVQQNGMLNAFSSFIFGRQYILINTEIFEVAYREHKDMNALAFIIAHEISHIYYGHATLHYNLPILFSSSIPLFGQIASRTREFSCDRLAQRLTNYDGVRAIMMLIVDRHLYPMVDVQDYVNTTINERGFFLWLINLLSTHPTMPKRLRALIQWNGSGELY